MNAFRDAMKQNVRPGRYSQDVLETIDRIVDVRDRLHGLRDRYGRDAQLTDLGRRTKLAETVLAKTLPEFAQATRRVRKSMSFLRAQRAGLEEPSRVDPADAVGELRRQEFRSYLRTLPQSERMHAAMQAVRDPGLSAAILDAPPFLSGLSEHFYGQFRGQVAQHVNGDKLAENGAAIEDYEQAEAAATVVRRELMEASGLTERGFAETMQPLETQADA